MTHPGDFASLRSHFPGATGSTYFDTASRGLVPAEAAPPPAGHRPG